MSHDTFIIISDITDIWVRSPASFKNIPSQTSDTMCTSAHLRNWCWYTSAHFDVTGLTDSNREIGEVVKVYFVIWTLYLLYSNMPILDKLSGFWFDLELDPKLHLDLDLSITEMIPLFYSSNTLTMLCTNLNLTWIPHTMHLMKKQLLTQYFEIWEWNFLDEDLISLLDLILCVATASSRRRWEVIGKLSGTKTFI